MFHLLYYAGNDSGDEDEPLSSVWSAFSLQLLDWVDAHDNADDWCVAKVRQQPADTQPPHYYIFPKSTG